MVLVPLEQRVEPMAVVGEMDWCYRIVAPVVVAVAVVVVVVAMVVVVAVVCAAVVVCVVVAVCWYH